jgi:thiol-disulfide isomerase/thioredoxin
MNPTRKSTVPAFSPASLAADAANRFFAPKAPNPVCHLLSDKPSVGFAVGKRVTRGWVVLAAVMSAGFPTYVRAVDPVSVGPEAAETIAVEAVAGEATVMGEEVADIWSAKAPVFQADASPDGPLTVLYFTATWCGYCRQMERTTLSNGSVRSWLAPFGRIKLDYDEQAELVAKYQIRGVPAFVLVDARGEEVSKLVGMTEADPFRGWLEAGKKRAVEMVKMAAERQAELKRIAGRLSANGETGWTETKMRIFELAGRGDSESRTFALKQLTVRAELEPAMLFDGLLHSDLAVRLAVAGVLRKTLGERFVFDPWADAVGRSRAVEQLAKATW